MTDWVQEIAPQCPGWTCASSEKARIQERHRAATISAPFPAGLGPQPDKSRRHLVAKEHTWAAFGPHRWAFHTVGVGGSGILRSLAAGSVLRCTGLTTSARRVRSGNFGRGCVGREQQFVQRHANGPLSRFNSRGPGKTDVPWAIPICFLLADANCGNLHKIRLTARRHTSGAFVCCVLLDRKMLKFLERGELE